MLCSLGCEINPPLRPDASCFIDSRPGGISSVIIFGCDVTFKDIYDKTEWCRYIQSGKIVLSNDILGKKDKASAVKKKMYSCRPEAVTGFDHTVTFQDYAADDLSFADYEFWNNIQLNQQSYQYAFITCDGLLLGYDPKTGGFIKNASVEVSNIVEDDYNANSYWDGAISWKGIEEPRPLKLNGLKGLFNSNDCNNLDPYASGFMQIIGVAIEGNGSNTTWRYTVHVGGTSPGKPVTGGTIGGLPGSGWTGTVIVIDWETIEIVIDVDSPVTTPGMPIIQPQPGGNPGSGSTVISVRIGIGIDEEEVNVPWDKVTTKPEVYCYTTDALNNTTQTAVNNFQIRIKLNGAYAVSRRMQLMTLSLNSSLTVIPDINLGPLWTISDTQQTYLAACVSYIHANYPGITAWYDTNNILTIEGPKTVFHALWNTGLANEKYLRIRGETGVQQVEWLGSWNCPEPNTCVNNIGLWATDFATTFIAFATGNPVPASPTSNLSFISPNTTYANVLPHISDEWIATENSVLTQMTLVDCGRVLDPGLSGEVLESWVFHCRHTGSGFVVWMFINTTGGGTTYGTPIGSGTDWGYCTYSNVPTSSGTHFPIISIAQVDFTTHTVTCPPVI